MKALRIGLWVMVCVFAGIAGYAWLTIGNGPAIVEASKAKVGAPFELIDHHGKPITQARLKDRRHAIFFGFTHCPDVCPTTLYETAAWMKDLGEDSNKIDFYFFSVDPERDTPDVLADYVNAFDERITGVTGDFEAMMDTVKSYKAYAKKVELEDGDYTVDHSAFVLLFDASGDFKRTISYGENSETAVGKLKRLIEDG
ncbi:MAG: SCO family protein [Pseudomonadota bacterium]